MKRLFILTAAVLAFQAFAVTTKAAEPVVVSGGGQVVVTDIFGDETTAAFSVAAVLNSSTKANGSVNLTFDSDFGAVWGVYPDETDSVHVYGKITGVTVAGDGTIKLSGEVTEVDLSHAGGVIFSTAGEPFEMVINPDHPSEFTFTWCLLPPFWAEVTAGGIDVR